VKHPFCLNKWLGTRSPCSSSYASLGATLIMRFSCSVWHPFLI
jgi:hypothetical protein